MQRPRPRSRRRHPALALCVLLGAATAGALPPAATAQDREDIRFAQRASSAQVAGTLQGQAYRDYVLGAEAGQTLTFNLAATGGDGDGTIYANVLPPGSDGVAILNGSMLPDGNGSVLLPDTGDYVLRVYLMGHDRDAGKTVEYALDTRIE